MFQVGYSQISRIETSNGFELKYFKVDQGGLIKDVKQIGGGGSHVYYTMYNKR